MESGDDVGLATVYRVLTQFEAAGLIIRHNFTDGHAVFELDSGDHHDRIVGLDCGVLHEFVDATIEKRQSKVAQYGFEIDDHSMTIWTLSKAFLHRTRLSSSHRKRLLTWACAFASAIVIENHLH